ncbi:MAG: hypothetical protein Q7R40_19995 [Phaeospirillum sp.]|nr:hypothetical protein [Phaeospirillum sp.]
MATNIAGVAQAAAETGQMSQGAFQAANSLLAESETLEREVEHFLAEVREAQSNETPAPGAKVVDGFLIGVRQS